VLLTVRVNVASKPTFSQVRAPFPRTVNPQRAWSCGGFGLNDLYVFEVASDQSWILLRLHYEPFKWVMLASGTDPSIGADVTMQLALFANHESRSTTLTVWCDQRELAAVSDPKGLGGSPDPSVGG
jgi:hypothetical protein